MESDKYKDILNIIQGGLGCGKEINQTSATIAIPYQIDYELAMFVLSIPNVDGVILHHVNAPYSNANNSDIGVLNKPEYTWTLPKNSHHAIVFLGQPNEIGFYMVRSAAKQGVKYIIYRSLGIWRSQHVYVYLYGRLIGRGLWYINRIKQTITKYLYNFTTINNRNYDKQCFSKKISSYNIFNSIHFFSLSHSAYYRLVKCWANTPLLNKDDFVTEKILLINTALAWGGAERQVVNTLHGLLEFGFNDVSLLCEMLNESDDHNFFSEQVPGLNVENLPDIQELGEDQLSNSVLHNIVKSLERLPLAIADDILRYVIYFYIKRPSIVHIWQDMTNIKAGLAAVIVGVPRIILAGRNVAPYNFSYYEHYMKNAYCALNTHGHIQMINNSNAGACDYADWLRINRDAIKVIHNGMHERFIERIPDKDVADYKNKLGIPLDAFLIGAVFRFYEEKDPLLWIRTAAIVAAKYPNAWFLIIGTGPMRDEMLFLAKELNFVDRLVMPGTDTKPANALSCMDVFLLTSLFEGTPNVLIEAQWIGVPVVSTDVGGARDTIDNGKTGWVVSKRDPIKLADKIHEILIDNEWRRIAKIQACDFVHKRFALERMIKDTIDIYEVSVTTLQ